MFAALQDWVEKGTAPGAMTLVSADRAVSLPVCVYPLTVTYRGPGPVTAADSHACE